MATIHALIGIPVCFALILFVVRKDRVRNALVAIAGVCIAALSVYMVVWGLGVGPHFYMFESHIFDTILACIDALLCIVVICFAIQYKNILALILTSIQFILALLFEMLCAPSIHVEETLYFDNLSLVMVFIIGVIGSLICVYACGYMEDFQSMHSGEHDRRPHFFAILFFFLSGMYLIVFSNDLSWLYTGWEITTVCSFLLIGYTKTPEAIHNAFRQIIMNTCGGIAFLAALMYAAASMHTLNLASFITMGTYYPELVTIPLVCFSFAGIVKAAQMPFHSWLLGAMVAPTPTSALLHSSTMVKAGVFLLIKFAPLYALNHIPAYMLIFVGGITFCISSFIAITQSNAKLVLAYSTIGNLGLITALAGIGTSEAVWAAIFLVIFHAVAKSLMFLCVGTAEHHIGSRNIEDMDQLFVRMPKLCRSMMVGAMVMFIAPFGMLVAKWATLVTLIDARLYALVILMIFGSAATFVFWAKWLGKLTGISGHPKNMEQSVHRSERFSIVVLEILSLVFSATIPLLSTTIVDPYLASAFGIPAHAISSDMLVCASVLTAAVGIVVFVAPHKHPRERIVDAYLSGVTENADLRTFEGPKRTTYTAIQKNMYLESWFGAKHLTPIGNIATSFTMAICFCAACGAFIGLL